MENENTYNESSAEDINDPQFRINTLRKTLIGLMKWCEQNSHDPTKIVTFKAVELQVHLNDIDTLVTNNVKLKSENNQLIKENIMILDQNKRLEVENRNLLSNEMDLFTINKNLQKDLANAQNDVTKEKYKYAALNKAFDDLTLNRSTDGNDPYQKGNSLPRALSPNYSISTITSNILKEIELGYTNRYKDVCGENDKLQNEYCKTNHSYWIQGLMNTLLEHKFRSDLYEIIDREYLIHRLKRLRNKNTSMKKILKYAVNKYFSDSRNCLHLLSIFNTFVRHNKLITNLLVTNIHFLQDELGSYSQNSEYT